MSKFLLKIFLTFIVCVLANVFVEIHSVFASGNELLNHSATIECKQECCKKQTAETPCGCVKEKAPAKGENSPTAGNSGVEALAFLCSKFKNEKILESQDFSTPLKTSNTLQDKNLKILRTVILLN